MSDLQKQETRRAVRVDGSGEYFPAAHVPRPSSHAPLPAPRRNFEIDSLPSFFVAPPPLSRQSKVDLPANSSTAPSQTSAVTFRKALQGVVAVSSHWGRPRILVDIKENVIARGTEDPRARLLRLAASRELAGRAGSLLRESGLTQRDEAFGPDIPSRRLSFGDVDFLPPVIRVSIPAHFGVDLMFLAGAALRPLTERPVLFVGMCGGIEGSLKDQLDQSNFDSMRRFVTRFPKHRLIDLYPLFVLIGASFGVGRGVLEQIIENPHSSARTSVPRRRQDDARPPEAPAFSAGAR